MAESIPGQHDDLFDDLIAALRARTELSPEDEEYLAQTFLKGLEQRLDTRIEARVDAKVAARLEPRTRGFSLSRLLAVAAFIVLPFPLAICLTFFYALSTSPIDAVVLFWPLLTAEYLAIFGIAVTTRHARRNTR